MIDTRLILVEGVPGSGKSTTAKTIMGEVTACGYKCNCYLEWGENNPSVIGHMEDLAKIISTTKAREENVLQQWKSFANIAMQQETINIIESRFWQTESMYLYLSGHSVQEIFESNRRVIAMISELDPVLIYLVPEDIEQLHTAIAMKRNEEWRESGRQGSWEEWGDSVYEQQKWFSDRSLDSKAITRFFNEWALIADKLFDRYPYRKLRIHNPHIDWGNTNDCIKEFLELNGC